MKTSGFVLGFALAIVVGFSSVAARNFHFRNNCSFTVWVGALNWRGYELPANGGWQMDSGATRDVGVAEKWRGRFWGRTSCDATGRCETGDCGQRLECAGAGGVAPATLAEFTLQGASGQDFYNVNLVDGFNLPMSIAPQGGQGSCKPTECRGDLIATCPEDLRQVNAAGQTIACMSDCVKYRKDELCCSNGHSKPENCPPPDYASIFRNACPTAFDDQRGTFTCTGGNYNITFC